MSQCVVHRGPVVLGVSPTQVIETATKLWKLDAKALRRRDKTWPLCGYRFAAMYVTRKVCGTSYPQTARAFNRLDHTTVMNACKRVEGDRRLMALAEKLERELDGSGGSFT